MEEARKKKHQDKSSKTREVDQDSSIAESGIANQPVQETSVRDEEELFIQKLTQPKQPKSKG